MLTSVSELISHFLTCSSLTFDLWVCRLEAAKDDYRIRCEELEKELVELRSQNEDLTSLADEAQSLKDEMDVLRLGVKGHVGGLNRVKSKWLCERNAVSYIMFVWHVFIWLLLCFKVTAPVST